VQYKHKYWWDDEELSALKQTIQYNTI